MLSVRLFFSVGLQYTDVQRIILSISIGFVKYELIKYTTDLVMCIFLE